MRAQCMHVCVGIYASSVSLPYTLTHSWVPGANYAEGAFYCLEGRATPEWLAFMSDRAKRDGRCEINLIEPHFLSFAGYRRAKNVWAHTVLVTLLEKMSAESQEGERKKDVSLCTPT